MKRLLCLNTQPYFHAKEIADRNQLTVFSPRRSAAKALGKRKQSLWDFATQILQAQGIAIAPPLDSQRALQDAIRQTLSTQDIKGTAQAWMPTIQTLLRSAPHLVATTENFSERSRLLIQVMQRYQEALRQQNLADLSEILWRALEYQPERKSVLIYGYFQPCLDELAFVDAIAGEGSIFYVPIAHHDLFTHHKICVEQLQKQGWQIESALSSPETPGEKLAQKLLSQDPEDLPTDSSITDSSITDSSIAAHVYSSPEAEARGVLAQVKQLLHNGVPAREIVVVARDEVACGSLLLDTAWEYGIPLRALYSIPLSSTRVGAWLTLLLEVIQQQFPFELTAQLLNHPLSVSAGAEFWATVRRQKPAQFDSWQTAAQHLIALDLSPLKFPTSARRDTWVEKLRGIFRVFDLRRRAARWARESVAYSTLEAELVALSQPESEILTRQAFANELLASLSVLTTPAQPGRGGVELHTPLSIMGARYRHVFVINALEGKLPAPVMNDRVLDFHERKQLQTHGICLTGAAEAARREAFEFYALLHTATAQFTLSYAKLAGEPSAYFKQLGLSPSPAPIAAVASLEEFRQVYLRQNQPPSDPVLEKAIASFQVEQHRESSAPRNEYDGILGTPFDYSEHWFSASQLTQLGQCPFKWFASKVLKLSKVEESSGDLDPGLRGTLYHKVLELAMKAAQIDAAIDFMDVNLLHNWFVEAEAIVNLPQLPAWSSRRIEHIHILRRAMQQPDFLQAGAEVIGIEQEFEGEWHGLKIRGRVDRIDRTLTGLTLVDYKTSTQPPAGVKDATGRAKIDLQLPLYEAVAAPIFYAEPAHAEPAHAELAQHRTSYYSLTAGKDISPRLKPAAADLEAVADRLKIHLTTGSYPISPDVERHACKYCAYDSVCRRSEHLNHPEESA